MQLGFSLIELMVGIVILGILASVAIPSFQSWMRNAQIRNAAESISNGLQYARAEAVSRNNRTQFVMCGATDSSWDVLAASGTAVAQSCNTADAVAPTGWERVQMRSANEGSRNVTVTVLPAGATTITFNNFGGIATNADGTARLSQFDLAATGSNRNLRVTIGVGGNTRMCDPILAPNSSPSAC